MNREKHPALTALLLSAVICCIHLGANEYLSVQFLAFALSAVIVWPSYFQQLHRLSIVAAVLLLVVAVSYVLAQHDQMTLLKGIRSVVVLLVLAAWQQRLQEHGADVAPVARRAVFLACSFSLALATAQFVDSLTVNSGLLEVPKAFYGIDYGTLASARREMGIFSRPSALFSEPSALGALGVMAVAVSYTTTSGLLRVMGFMIVVVSQSLSGLVLATGISLVSVRWKNGTVMAICVVAAAGLTFFLMGDTADRIVQVFSATDLSGRIRLFEPLLVLRDMFRMGLYFGGSSAYLMSLASPEVQTIFDNWLISQFLLYGVLGSLWVLLSFLFLRVSLWPLLAAYMVTNGDAFYYDRYFLLLMAMAAISDVGSRRTDDFNRNCYV